MWANFIGAIVFINIYVIVISALIIFLNKVISKYEPCKIVINDDKEFVAQGGKSLLRLLFENKYFIPSACGGKGTCGYCKLKVLEGGGDALPTEGLILSSTEIRQGFRLACQLKVRNNLRVLIPPEYLEIKEYNGEVLSSELVTRDIKKIRIKILPPDEISFKPGQYVQIKFPTPEGIDYRAYSIASSPEDRHAIELNVKLIPEGLGSSYMHSLQPGDPVQFSGPYGEFYLQTESSRKIICVAGGVGLAPIKSIVLYWDAAMKNREIELYYGSRTLKDLYDHDIFRELAERHAGFHYYPALSDEDPEWKGDRGFIHTVMAKHLEQGGKAEAYLCGPPIMIDAVTETLQQKGVPQERILYDKF